MSLRLFVKVWCPWCVRAQEYLDQHGYRYELLDVESDRRLMDEMIALSGQRRTPTLQAGAHVLPDFGPDELADFLAQHQLQP